MKKSNFSILRFFNLCLFLGLAMSCQKTNSTNIQKIIAGKFVSVAPKSDNLKLIIVELKTPPLLSKCNRDKNGRIVIDDTLKEELLSEQDKFKSELLKLSEKIQIIYDYQLVFNGFTIAIPANIIPDLEKVVELQSLQEIPQNQIHQSSTELIGEPFAEFENPNKLYELLNIDGIRNFLPNGKDQTIAVIDSGIDLSHRVFNKYGSKTTYQELKKLKNIDFDQFPKIAGGIDLVGDHFFRNSTNKTEYIPQIDFNPLDYNGHGTAISSIINGEGDGVNSVDGLLPEAKIFSIRVLGQSGSIDQFTILKGLEVVADPSLMMNPNNHLKIVNASLGQAFFGNYGMLKKAVHYLSELGVSIIGASGNSGNYFSNTGGISSLDEVISVGSSTKTDREFQLGTALELTVQDDPNKKIKLIFRDCTLCQKFLESNQGADKNTFPIALMGTSSKESIKNSIALVSLELNESQNQIFDNLEKKVIELKSLGAVAGAFYTDDFHFLKIDEISKKLNFPLFVLQNGAGNFLVQEFQNNNEIQIFGRFMRTTSKENEAFQSELVSKFSSRGPRFDDFAIKPEVLAPGEQIPSAKLESGFQSILETGTSLSTPIVTSLVGMMKEKFPHFSSRELKDFVVNHTRVLMSKSGEVEPVISQGAGVIDIKNALNGQLLVSPSTLSLKRKSIDGTHREIHHVTLRNLSEQTLFVNSQILTRHKNVSVLLPTEIKISARESISIPVEFIFSEKGFINNQSIMEVDGYIQLLNQKSKEIINVPFLVYLEKHSKVGLSNEGLTNLGNLDGRVRPFYKIGFDEQKNSLSSKAPICDLKSAGFRILNKQNKDFLEFGMAFYDFFPIWENCDVSVLIDSNLDGEADYELLGASKSNIAGINEFTKIDYFSSTLFDAKKVESAVARFEKNYGNPMGSPLNISSGILQSINLSSEDMTMTSQIVLPVEMNQFKIMKQKNGKYAPIGIKIVSQNFHAYENPFDYLGNHKKEWQVIHFDNVEANALKDIVIKKGRSIKGLSSSGRKGKQEILFLAPQNSLEMNVIPGIN